MDSETPDLDPELKADPLAASLRLEARPYRPDSGFSLPGMLLTLAISLIAALAVGWLLSWAKQGFYILLVFPTLAGLLVGMVGVFGIKSGKVRNAQIAGLTGLCAGLLSLVSMHYFDYLRFQETMATKPRAKIVVGVRVMAGDEDLGFLKYVDRKAEKGIVVRFIGHWNLEYFGSYFYWVCEALLAGWVALAVMASQTLGPFCTLCDRWKVSHRLARLNMAPEAAQDLVNRGELVRLADYRTQGNRGQIFLTVWTCGNCREESTVEVKLDEVTQNAEGVAQTRQLAFVSYPGKALPILKELFVRGGRAEEKEEEGEEE